jgi:hypothetical protein
MTIFDKAQRDMLNMMEIDWTKLIIDYSQRLVALPITEKTASDSDFTLNGLFCLIKVLLQKFPDRKKLIGQDYGLTRHCIHDCLFQFPKETGLRKGVGPPKCKHQNSRKNAFLLLSVLTRDCLENLEESLRYTIPLHVHGTWRTKRENGWGITPMNNEKSITGYVGIKNLGCICYMISLLQQLFMIPTFREDILKINDPNALTTPKDDNVFYQL